MNRQKIVFPLKGLDSNRMLAELRAHRSMDVSWRNGRMFGYIYHAGSRESKAIEQAYHLFFNENALNPSLFSSLRQLENETVAMVADLLHAGEDYAGNLTTGGSESILVAVKTARDWAKHSRPSPACLHHVSLPLHQQARKMVQKTLFKVYRNDK